MAQVRRTRDPNIWFNPNNFQEAPGEGALAALTALQDGQVIALLLNGVQTQWARFAGGAPALRAADAIARQTWAAIPVDNWVPLVIVGVGVIGPAPVEIQAIGEGGVPPMPPAPEPDALGPDAAPPAQYGRLFDVYLFIDWSATNNRAAAPGPDQLWLAEQLAGAQPVEHWFPTRRDCARHVEQRLLLHVGLRRRVLLGFDFPYGYPSGLVDAAGLPAPAGKWLAVWTALSSLLSDDEENHSNRFNVAAALNAMMTPDGGTPGPFWNTPTPSPMLTANSPAFPYAASNGVNLCQWRIVEQHFQQRGLHPQSAFKLFTPGSVGSQSLTGIPIVHRIRHRPLLRDLSLVWPFETGFTGVVAPNRRPFVLHAEIWPGVVQEQTQQLMADDPRMIKDQAQVRAMCLWADAQDTAGTLGPFFSPPANVPQADLERCVCEEGWVLGAEGGEKGHH